MTEIKKKNTALIIDDEKLICSTLADVIRDEGWSAVVAHSGEEGLEKFRQVYPDIVFLDVWMPGIDGIETLYRIREFNKRTPVVVMSGHGTIETAVKATRLGAFDFLEKPMSLDKILPILEHAKSLISDEKGKLESGYKVVDIIGESQAINDIRKQISLVAPRHSWVFLTGENGTGKEVVARNIHFYSPRRDKPFIAVNCAAIPEDLIESELFGYVKGAFTNALQTKKGKFELAHRGTLFLDEIGDMSLKTQAKVLRILQEQAFERLGDTETIHIDVRVIAATNKDLKQEIEKGNFREDLFYRLNVIPMKIPPMRERRPDIPILVRHFLQMNALELGEPLKKVSDEAMLILQHHNWPGNVREIKNLTERLCIMVSKNIIEEEDLPDSIQSQELARGNVSGHENMDEGSADEMAAAARLKGTLKEAKWDFERSFILNSLKENQWNISKTAEAIGIERSNLHKKLKLYDIDFKDQKEDQKDE